MARWSIYDPANPRFVHTFTFARTASPITLPAADGGDDGWIRPGKIGVNNKAGLMARMTLKDAYLIYCTQGKGRDDLWMEVHFQSTISLNRLIKKTGVRLPAEDKADLLTDIDCRVMEKLDKKQRIGNISGIIYFAAMGELRKRGKDFSRANSEIDLGQCERVPVYQCSHPGCPEILREPGFCKEHSPLPAPNTITLTTQQAADETGLSERTIKTMIQRGTLKSIKIMGRRIIKKEDLYDIMN